MAKHAAPRRPVSLKVAGSTVGGGVVAQFVLWVLNSFAFGGDMYDLTPSRVPYAVSALVVALIVFAAGYLPSDEASALFASQEAEDPTVYGNAMGAGPAPEVDTVPDVLPDDTDDGTTNDDDEQPRDARGRFVAEQ